jgi:hypothetical protein
MGLFDWFRRKRSTAPLGEPVWFPPISDSEFLARSRPGTDPAVALKVRRLVADHFGIEYARVHPSMSFIEDLGAD